MPKNKAQLRRIKGIDDRLNRWRRAKKNRLSSIFLVSERQISRDIKYMKEEFGAPIMHDNDGYYYSYKFNIPLNLALTGEEISQLKLAVQTLHQYQHLEAFSNLGGLLEKLEQSMKFKLPNNHKNIISFEKIPFYKGTELISFFLEAIENTNVVTFDYQSFKSKSPISHILHPYILKENTNRWYVIGYSPVLEDYCTFALERIVQNDRLKIMDYFFEPKADFEEEKFFEYTYGMTVLLNKKVEEIYLSFTPIQARYFESKPFHKYEQVKKSNGKFIVKMHLIPNLELVRKIASLGNGVMVLKPKSLANQVYAFLSDASKQYDFTDKFKDD